jgi:hypothetical protein
VRKQSYLPRAFLICVQMVYYHNEYRCCVDSTSSATIQRIRIADYFNHLLRLKSYALSSVPVYFLSPILYVSQDISRCTPTSTPKLIPRDIPGWSCNAHQYDSFGVCTGMGSWNGYSCLGALVDSDSLGVDDLFSFDLCNVSIS